MCCVRYVKTGLKIVEAQKSQIHKRSAILKQRRHTRALAIEYMNEYYFFFF